MKKTVRVEIERFVREYRDSHGTVTPWEIPLVGFASASDPLFQKLKAAVSPTHAVPQDLLAGAATVVAFFLPFTRELTRTNEQGREASEEWARAYLETNELIRSLSLHVKAFLETRDEKACLIPATHNFDPRKLMSDWSHRHVAFIAGLGRFGLNNMLITDRGCCGRIGSLVTTALIEPDPPFGGEACLYRHNGTCRRCVERCVNGALSSD